MHHEAHLGHLGVLFGEAGMQVEENFGRDL